MGVGIMKTKSFLVLSSLVFGFSVSQAAEMNEIKSPNGVTELCQKPQMFPFLPNDLEQDGNSFQGNWYRKKDFEDIDALCSLSFYQPEIGTCPKLFSTNPGVEMHSMTKMTKADFEKNECKKAKDRAEDKIAKFKQTVTCSKTASILSYYHVSRILGNQLHIPIATYRTMDKDEHAKIIAYAKKYGPADMQAFWGGSMNKAMGVKGQMVTESPEKKPVIFGAIADNPNGEDYHQRLNGAGKTKEARVASLVGRDFYNVMTSAKPALAALGAKSSDLTLAQLQILVNAMDSSNHTILDYIMGQEDRYGNIHQKDFSYYIDAKNELEEEVKEKKVPEAFKASAVRVNRVLLKDNDCGLRGAVATGKPVFEKIRHMQPITYYRLQWLANVLKDAKGSEDSAAFFKDVALFSKTDFETVFKKRVIEVADRFKSLCQKGELHLDLDLELAIRKQLPVDNKKISCE